MAENTPEDEKTVIRFTGPGAGTTTLTFSKPISGRVDVIVQPDGAAYPGQATAPTLLQGTSQGTKFELPSEYWIRDELLRFGAIGTSPGAADLTGDIHPLFERSRWPESSDERYNSLRQSFLLATKLLSVAAGEYLPNFLPTPEASFLKQDDLVPGYERLGKKWPIIQYHTNWNTSQQRKAIQILKDMAEFITWYEDNYLFIDAGALGINAAWKEYDEPIDLQNACANESWEEARIKATKMGHKYRKFYIGITNLFAATLTDCEPGSERHLLAIFMAAITITHEIGHAIFLSNANLKVSQDSPLVGLDAESELGDALISFLFGGWTPNPIDIGQRKYQRGVDVEGMSFKNGLFWNKIYRRPGPREVIYPRPGYRTMYSIPVAHIKRILTQSEWDKYGDPTENWQTIRKELLAPQSPFRRGHHARVAFANNKWNMVRFIGSPRWAFEEKYEDKDWDDQPSAPESTTGSIVNPSSKKRERSPEEEEPSKNNVPKRQARSKTPKKAITFMT